MNDLLGVALRVINVLELCGIRYTIGGCTGQFLQW